MLSDLIQDDISGRSKECEKRASISLPKHVGQRQSPIEINSSAVEVVTAEPLIWTSGYSEIPTESYAICEDNAVRLHVQVKNPLRISGGVLEASYTFDHLHFHWGMEDNIGCEHKIDGKVYPLEMHLVHVITEAQPEVDDFFAVSYFFKIDDKTTMGLENFLKVIESAARNPGTKQDVQPFALSDLVPNSPFSYYTYKGSRTTPPFEESVTFIISTTVLSITPSDMNIFRNACLVNEQLKNNFRDSQFLNDRMIYFVKNTST